MIDRLLKVEGAGNDFLLGTGVWAERLATDPELVARLCRRRRGVGADGVLAVRRTTATGVELTYRNGDGSEAPFCANGTRCAARAAHEILGLPSRLEVVTGWELIPAEVHRERVTLTLPVPGRAPEPVRLEAQGEIWEGWVVEVGVPQLVVAVGDVKGLDLCAIAPSLRSHPSLGPEGANVSFSQPLPDGRLRVRSWERGIEGETLSCGSGVVAAALAWMAELGRTELACGTASGEELLIAGGDEAADCGPRLTGPARFVAVIDRVFEDELASTSAGLEL